MRTHSATTRLVAYWQFVIKRLNILFGCMGLSLNARVRCPEPDLFRLFLSAAYSNIEQLHRKLDEYIIRYRHNGVFHFGNISFVTQDNDLALRTAPGSYELFFYPFFYGADAYSPLLTEEAYYWDRQMTIKSEDIVLDVGANLGAFSIVASKLAKKGIVYAFEPLKENTECFERNMDLNDIRNARLIQKALSDKVGRANFFHDEKSPASSSLLTVEFKRAGNQTVESATID